MERPLTILLIEDEPQECQELIQYIESINEVRLVGVINNSKKALDYAVDTQPDAIILDLELHKGYGNGISFLQALHEKKLPFPIYVLVTTYNLSSVTHESVRKNGADFIMLKSQEDYNAKTVIDFLSSLKTIIQNNKKAIDFCNTSEMLEVRKRREKTRVIRELEYIGISPSTTGRKYLIDSILHIVNEEAGSLLTTISKKYCKTEASVERAMQNAIDKAWRTTHIFDLEKYYTPRIKSARGVPTIMEFIYYYGEKIKSNGGTV